MDTVNGSILNVRISNFLSCFYIAKRKSYLDRKTILFSIPIVTFISRRIICSFIINLEIKITKLDIHMTKLNLDQERKDKMFFLFFYFLFSVAFSWLFLQALKIIWLPVLTTIPQSQELSREFQQLNNNISSLPLGTRGVRNLNILPELQATPRALCSYCRYDILHLGPEWVRGFSETIINHLLH